MQLTIDGETFRVEVEGPEEKPAVLLSPSLGSNLSLFDAQMPALLEHFRVVRYDPRGHGGSSSAGAPYSLAQLARDALAILDALAIQTVHFIGISMGGAVGQWLLVNAPQRLGRAVLANTAARIGAPTLWNARITTVCAQGTQALAPATMERWFSPAFHERSAERIAAVDAVFRQMSSEGYAGACAALRDMDMREAIRGITKPVLIVSGREDPVTSVDDISLLTSVIRGARHLALDCRHISNIEQDEAFNAAVVTFLTAPLSTRAPRRPLAPRRAVTRRSTAARSPLKPASADARTTVASLPRAAPAKAAPRGRGAVGGSATATGAKSKKSATGKLAAKKATRKAAARRQGRKASAARATPGKAAPKIVAKTAKKTAAKKVPARKTAAKKTAAKNPTARRTATARRPGPKRPSRPGGRKR